jgi:hypothetical protein
VRCLFSMTRLVGAGAAKGWNDVRCGHGWGSVFSTRSLGFLHSFARDPQALGLLEIERSDRRRGRVVGDLAWRGGGPRFAAGYAEDGRFSRGGHGCFYACVVVWQTFWCQVKSLEGELGVAT